MNSRGQALFEYIIVLAFTVLVLGRFLNTFGEFAADSIGRFNVVLGFHLTTGLCASECWAGSYLNGRELQ